jgi:hypothetical protein
MSAHNFGTVLSFELRRTLLRPIYWLTTLSVPALMAIIVALSFFSGSTAADRAQSAGDRVSFQYVDASGIVAADVATRLGGTPATDPAAAESAVQQGTLDAFVSVPADPITDPVRIVARDEGLLNSNQWYSLARQLVSDSAAQRLGDDRLVELTRGVPMTLETWKDGRPSAGLSGAVMPAFFLILLYAAILMLGQQMLNITVEEKENRVTEMILTTIRPAGVDLGQDHGGHHRRAGSGGRFPGSCARSGWAVRVVSLMGGASEFSTLAVAVGDRWSILFTHHGGRACCSWAGLACSPRCWWRSDRWRRRSRTQVLLSAAWYWSCSCRCMSCPWWPETPARP